MSTNTIDRLLYDEMILKIFSYLNLRSLHNVGQVNRRWSKLARKSWRSLKCLKFYTLFNTPELPKGKYLNKALHYALKKCGRNLRTLNMYDPEPEFRFVKINERTLIIIGKYCPNLEEVNFTDVLFLNDLLHTFVDHLNCQKLKIVNLHSSFNHYCVIHNGLSALYSACTSVTYLDISNSLNARVRDCSEPWPRTLTEVHVDNAWALTSYSLMTLAKCSSGLRAFSMNGHQSGMDQGLEYILQNCDLTKLSLVDYPGTVELGLQICHMTKLRELYLGGSNMVCDDVISAVAYSCPKLEILHINSAKNYNESSKCGRLTDDGFTALAQYLPGLKEFVINYRQYVTDDGLINVLSNGNLQKLSIRGCTKISDVSLSMLSRTCPRLKEIDVTSVPLITMDGVVELCKGWFEAITNYDDSSYSLDFWAEDMVLSLNDIFLHCQLEDDSQHANVFTSTQSGFRKTIRFYTDMLLSIFH